MPRVPNVIDLSPVSAYVSPGLHLQHRGVCLPISASDAISPAYERAKQQLFHPFRFGQWARLAFVGILAGEAGNGGGCNSGFNSPWSARPQRSPSIYPSIMPPLFVNHPAYLVGLIALLAVLIFGLTLIFLYINSIMRFILFDSVISGECRVRRGWVRRRSHGRRLFRWQVLLMFATLAVILIVIGIPAAVAWAIGWFANPGEHILRLVLTGIVAFLIFIALVTVGVLIQVLTKDFVVPQMALEDITAIEGWRRLWPMLKAEKGGYAGYIGMKIVLAIVAGIILGIITLIALFILLIPIGGVGAIAVLAGKAAGLTWTVYTITLIVIAGCAALALFVFVAALISVPAIVFFPAYSIYFFATRYPALAALLWPAPATPTV
jgi:hypothetical protein